jgi:hypothetical protein
MFDHPLCHLRQMSRRCPLVSKVNELRRQAALDLLGSSAFGCSQEQRRPQEAKLC